MSKHQTLRLMAMLDAIKSVDWAKSALCALGHESIEFLGNGENPASSAAEDLVRLYVIRLERSKQIGISQSGCEELVEKLSELDGKEMVQVWPFATDVAVVTAFLTQEGRLIGCVTTPRAP